MLNHKARSGLAFLAAASLALLGCGGGGRGASSSSVPSPARTAALRLKMVWPSMAPRMVPNAANSVVAVVTVNGTEVARSLFTRPVDNRSPIDAGSTTTLLSALPAGTAQVSYAAYPTVDGSGTAQAKGSATETLVAGQTTEDTASMASTVSELSLSLGSSILQAGQSTVATVSAKDASGATVLLETRYSEALEFSSSDASVAGVSFFGRVSTLAAGTAELKASMVVDDAGTKKTASATLTVTPVKVVKVVVDGTQSVMAGNAIDLTATATMSDETSKIVTSEATWSTTDASVATVDATGKVTGVAEGSATISATYGGETATFSVSVVSVASVRVTGPLTVAIGGTVQMTATATISDGTTRDVTSEATWTTDTDYAATVDATGRVTGVGPGTVVVSAAYGGARFGYLMRTTPP